MGSRAGTLLPGQAADVVSDTVKDGLLTVAGAVIPFERIISLASGLKDIVQFGRTENQIYHAFRHVERAGLCKESVADAVAKQLGELGDSMPVGTGEAVTVVVD